MTDRTWLPDPMGTFGHEQGSARWKLPKHPQGFSKGTNPFTKRNSFL